MSREISAESRKQIEKAKFRRFYLFGSIFWFLMVNLYYFGSQWASAPERDSDTADLFDNLLVIIFAFLIVGIPLIFLLSFGLRFAEKILDKIKVRIDQKKNPHNTTTWK